MKSIMLSEFINRSNQIHDYFYDYSKINNYQNTSSVVSIICPNHGEFLQNAYNHLHGSKCMKCGYEIAGDKHRKYPKGSKEYVPNRVIARTLEECIKKFNQVHNNKYDYSLLTDNIIDIRKDRKVKLQIICPAHGIFEQCYDDHKGGNGCQQCKVDKISKSSSINNLPKRLTFDKFVLKSNQIHNNVYDYSLVKIETRDSCITIICQKHGQFIQKKPVIIYLVQAAKNVPKEKLVVK